MIDNKVLNIFNNNVVLENIIILSENISKLKTLLFEIDSKTDTEKIKYFIECFHAIFHSIDDKIITYDISRLVKPHYLSEPPVLDIWNSDLFLSITINSDVEILDEKFYSGNLNLLLKYYSSCFKKINNYLLDPNRNLLKKVEAMIEEKVLEINKWVSSVYDRRIIESREKLKNDLIEKLPFKSFTYAASIKNVESILKLGLLSHNKIKSQSISHTDISDNRVNEMRSKPNMYLGNKPAHDFVNLHLNPQNPIIYHFVANSGGKENLVFFKINPHILVQKNGYFSKGNVAKSFQNQHVSGISNKIEEFEKLNWEIIRMPNPKNNNYEERKGEVLIETIIELKYIEEIIVYNNESLINVMKYYPNHLGIKIMVDPKFFDAIR